MRRRVRWWPGILALTAGACTGADGPAGGRAVFCVTALPEALVAVVTPDVTASDLRPLLFSTLVRTVDDGSVAPSLATDWRWNDARTEVAFTLRDDVTWHDGTPVTADDVAWTLRVLADPELALRGGATFATLADAAVEPLGLVRVRFTTPFAADIEPFASVPILPRHLLDGLEGEAFARAPYHRDPVGSGPFRVAGRLPDGAIRLVRHDAYPAALGRPALDQIVVRGVPEVTTQLIELQTGGADACVMGATRAAEAEETGVLRSLAIPPAGVLVVPLDHRRAPLDDARVRRALSAALDRSTIARAISPVLEPARTFLPAGSRWIDPAFVQPDADAARAAALLDSAGWAVRGPDGIRRDAAGRPLRVVLTAPQPFRAILTVLQDQWRRAGIDVDLRFMEGAAYVSTIRDPATRPQAMALSIIPERLMHPDPWEQLHSDGGSNLSAYRNAAVDSVLSRLRVPVEDAERAQLYRALQARVAEDVPQLYVLYVGRALVHGRRLSGVRTDPTGPFASVADWRVAPAADTVR